MLWVNQTIKIKRAAKLGGFAHAHRTTGLPRSSPTGFDKNLHPTGSIFPKNLVNRATPTFSRAFSFLFFPFFFSLLKMSVRSAASIILMACYMKSFRLKTHRLGTTYNKPHFFILNKGLNSGKPLCTPCPNCFVCLLENEADREFLYWLCFGLWRSKSFHFYLKGSVIPFITIDEIRKVIRESEVKASTKEKAFEKSIQALKLLDVNEQKIKLTLKMIDTARQSIFHNLMKETGAG
ncbi:DUF6943 family protein [Cyclobacterium marinum]|uniref:Uncharacterized protein n=2 Tax=Cyclobacteriaceae TaxID=563798 RepID=G0IXM6_CYCMS|nr:hypothetical protein [Cyclobacterium marinum]AEL28023.1 hypothetical protein Cycma_4320 [Cyclobacterium marinum DSM 745]